MNHISFREKKHSLGMVVTTSPTCNLYRIVVFPAPSNPKIKILISRVPNKLEKIVEKKPPTKKKEKETSIIRNVLQYQTVPN